MHNMQNEELIAESQVVVDLLVRALASDKAAVVVCVLSGHAQTVL